MEIICVDLDGVEYNFNNENRTYSIIINTTQIQLLLDLTEVISKMRFLVTPTKLSP